jgi:hypothetical protein
MTLTIPLIVIAKRVTIKTNPHGTVIFLLMDSRNGIAEMNTEVTIPPNAGQEQWQQIPYLQPRKDD